jgi:hypothetical protein
LTAPITTTPSFSSQILSDSVNLRNREEIKINEFPELELLNFFDAFENKEEDDGSKLAIINPLTKEKLQEKRKKTQMTIKKLIGVYRNQEIS